MWNWTKFHLIKQLYTKPSTQTTNTYSNKKKKLKESKKHKRIINVEKLFYSEQYLMIWVMLKDYSKTFVISLHSEENVVNLVMDMSLHQVSLLISLIGLSWRRSSYHYVISRNSNNYCLSRNCLKFQVFSQNGGQGNL